MRDVFSPSFWHETVGCDDFHIFYCHFSLLMGQVRDFVTLAVFHHHNQKLRSAQAKFLNGSATISRTGM